MRYTRPAFDWWEDALEVARLTAAFHGRRYRVRYVPGPRPWQVVPTRRTAPLAEEVPC